MKKKAKYLLKRNSLFVNYFKRDQSKADFNVRVARIILGAYLIWKIASVKWGEVAYWSKYSPKNYGILTSQEIINNLHVLEGFLILSLVLFTIGYKSNLTSLISGILTIYLGTTIQNLSSSVAIDAFFVSGYILAIFSIYGEKNGSNANNSFEVSSKIKKYTKQYNIDQVRGNKNVLKWSLVMIGALYFISGVSKIFYGPISEWTTATNIGRNIVYSAEVLGKDPILYNFLLTKSLFLEFVGFLTVILELSLFISTVRRLSVTVPILGLICFHILAYLGLGIIFLDNIILLCLFLNWNYLRTEINRKIEKLV